MGNGPTPELLAVARLYEGQRVRLTYQTWAWDPVEHLAKEPTTHVFYGVLHTETMHEMIDLLKEPEDEWQAVYVDGVFHTFLDKSTEIEKTQEQGDDDG